MAHSCPYPTLPRPALQTWPAPPWSVNLTTFHHAEHCALSDPQLSLRTGSHVYLCELGPSTTSLCWECVQ